MPYAGTDEDKQFWDEIFGACRKRIEADPDPRAPLKTSLVLLAVAADLWHWKLRPGVTRIQMAFDENFFAKCAREMFAKSGGWLPKD